MKKLILIAFSCLALMLTGCKDKSPEFKLDLTGTVVETTTHITTDFKVATTNVVNTYFATGETAAYPQLTKAEYPDAYQWLKTKVIKSVTKNFPNGALYDITAIGYVEWHGVKLSINEHWENPKY